MTGSAATAARRAAGSRSRRLRGCGCLRRRGVGWDEVSEGGVVAKQVRLALLPLPPTATGLKEKTTYSIQVISSQAETLFIQKLYLHRHRQMRVSTMMKTAATEAPTATTITSPSISQRPP